MNKYIMPNILEIKDNDVENGYIYKEIISRMNTLETEYEELKNILSTLNENNVSLEDIVNVKKLIDEKAKIEYVNNHINNEEVHISEIKKMEWNNKYNKPSTGIPETDLSDSLIQKINNNASAGFIKYVTRIGDNINKVYVVTHGLQTKTLLINIRDIINNKVVYADINYIDNNSIRISFNNVAQIEQYEVFLAR